MAALLGQHPLPANAAKAVGKTLDLDDAAVALLQTVPVRGSIGNGLPTDPTIYRFYEIVQVYGTTLKALVHEKFGDGIINAINFKLSIEKVEDPEGASRAVITARRQIPSDQAVLTTLTGSAAPWAFGLPLRGSAAAHRSLYGLRHGRHRGLPSH
nr:cyanase [Ciceribacter naphthalenivorans]